MVNIIYNMAVLLLGVVASRCCEHSFVLVQLKGGAWYIPALCRLVSGGPLWSHCDHSVLPGGAEQCLGVPGELQCTGVCGSWMGSHSQIRPRVAVLLYTST